VQTNLKNTHEGEINERERITKRKRPVNAPVYRTNFVFGSSFCCSNQSAVAHWKRALLMFVGMIVLINSSFRQEQPHHTQLHTITDVLISSVNAIAYERVKLAAILNGLYMFSQLLKATCRFSSTFRFSVNSSAGHLRAGQCTK
jgi:hypothetical protein